MEKVRIIGAGLAGLLAANMLQRLLPDYEVEVYEKQKELPNNHSSLLRFKGLAYSEAVGVPFTKVTVIKDCIRISEDDNLVQRALQYSKKCTGIARSDRSIISCPEVVERYIAPGDLIRRLASRVNIFNGVDMNSLDFKGTPTISTVPMPDLMVRLDYSEDLEQFTTISGVHIRFRVADVWAHASLYVPDIDVPIRRISITNDQIDIECRDFWNEENREDQIADAIVFALGELGIKGKPAEGTISAKPSLYSKILPVQEKVRTQFMMYATDNYNIYSLGRFATWRPGVQLDDLVKDVQQIARWVDNRYQMIKERKS